MFYDLFLCKGGYNGDSYIHYYIIILNQEFKNKNNFSDFIQEKQYTYFSVIHDSLYDAVNKLPIHTRLITELKERRYSSP